MKMQRVGRGLAAIAAGALIAAVPAAPGTVAATSAEHVPTEQNDADTGRDAGTSPATSIPIERGIEYDATLVAADTSGAVGDYDWFAFNAEQGEAIQVVLLSQEVPESPNCISIFDASEAEIGNSGCSDVASFTAPHDGVYFAEFGYFVTPSLEYRFVVDPRPATLGVTYDSAARDMRPDPGTPTVIVAVGDTGVNPYHEAYQRPHLTVHPCMWVAGFDDCSIPALNLSIGVYDSYTEAVNADLDLWQQVTVGQWYWIPGTNIIGAVCDGSSNATGNPPEPSPEAPCILDEVGHGTSTTSSVLSEAPNALLLVHEGNSGAWALQYAPVTPDIQSKSWGPLVPLPAHAADPVTGPAGLGVAGPGPYDPATLFFISAGNEALFPAIVDVSRVHPSIQIVGGGFPGKMSASSWTTFDYASWLCRPTAAHDSIDGVLTSSCGTSFAAPTVAGTAAAAILELRHAEGYTGRATESHVSPGVTRDAFIAALRRAATYDAEQRFNNTGTWLGAEAPLVDGYEHLAWGYGWLDSTRIGTIVSCATGDACPTPSPEAARWNEARQEARRRQTEPLLP